MTTPLDVAVDIGRIVLEAQAASLPLNVCVSADEIISRFPLAGLSRSQVLEALKEEAGAVGLAQN